MELLARTHGCGEQLGLDPRDQIARHDTVCLRYRGLHAGYRCCLVAGACGQHDHREARAGFRGSAASPRPRRSVELGHHHVGDHECRSASGHRASHRGRSRVFRRPIGRRAAAACSHAAPRCHRRRGCDRAGGRGRTSRGDSSGSHRIAFPRRRVEHVNGSRLRAP